MTPVGMGNVLFNRNFEACASHAGAKLYGMEIWEEILKNLGDLSN